MKPSIQERIGALVDDRLLDLLTEVHPPKNPKPGTPLDRVFYDAGQLDLIAYLRECQKQSRQP